jgi:ABC-type uncharacterized transport system involved in gliding motility auxiliary subunit
MSAQKGHDFKKALISTTGLLVLLVIIILLNVIFSYANIRWDATEDKSYTLSGGTRTILSNMEQPVVVKFFYNATSRNIPANLKLYSRRVKDFLSEYEKVSGGKLRVEMVDPKEDSDEEEWARKYGLKGFQVGGDEQIYCGLVFLAADQEDRIEFLDPSREDLLEYDITRIIQRLQNPKKKVIGIVTGLPVFGAGRGMPFQQQGGADPWLFVTEMRKTYDVREIAPTADKIEPVDLLVLLHPKDLPAKMQYAVDQYVLSGGNVLVLVDPLCVVDTSQQQGFPQPSASNLEKLFAAWGIGMDKSKVVLDLDQPTRLRRGNAVEDNPAWISARKGAFNPTDVVTSKLENMLFPMAGSIKAGDTPPREMEVLVRSGKNAGLVDAFKATVGPDVMRRDFVADAQPQNLAVRLRGKFKTAFPEGMVDESKSGTETGAVKEEGDSKQLRESTKPANIVIVADADMLADDFYVQKTRLAGFVLSKVFNDNLNFLLNACEILTGSDELIGLRSRGKYERPFTAVLELQRLAQERWMAKENELVQRAEETNRTLQELEQKKDASQTLILSPEQEAEIAKFKEERVRVNLELKEVRKNLRADVESLGTKLKWINILLMPLIVCVVGIGYALHRQRRMRRR